MLESIRNTIEVEYRTQLNLFVDDRSEGALRCARISNSVAKAGDDASGPMGIRIVIYGATKRITDVKINGFQLDAANKRAWTSAC